MFIPRTLIVGPERHGVTRYAHDLGEAIARLEGVPLLEPHLDGGAAEKAAKIVSRAHLHVTDKIFGSSPEDAADRIVRMSRTCPFTVTLHDLPQPREGELNFRRRSAAYRRIAQASLAVAVSSGHELALFTRYIEDAPSRAAMVAPLGARDQATRRSRPVRSLTTGRSDLIVLLAGFVYPGKGHENAIRAAAEFGARFAPGSAPALRVRALGGVSDGHEAEHRRLHELATALGVQFEVTGFLSDDDYTAAQAGPGVPVAAHHHISASRTMLDWFESGRKPLVVASDYAREMDTLRPGTLRLYDQEQLPDALEAAWLNPQTTYLTTRLNSQWTLEDAAAAYVHWWKESVIW